jgi:hypothetical protein
MRKKTHEEYVVQKGVDWFQAPAIDIKDVGHRLESIEGNPDWKDDAEVKKIRLKAEVGNESGETIDEEIEVLERAQKNQIDRYT